jgi:hypothetical protein
MVLSGENMRKITKFWWIFLLIGTIAAFANPFVGLFALIFGGIILFLNGIFMIVARKNNLLRSERGVERMAKAQRPVFWGMLFWEIIFAGIFILMTAAFPTLANGRILSPVTITWLSAAQLTILTSVITLIFATLSFVCAAIRLYDLVLNKNYNLLRKQKKAAGGAFADEKPHGIKANVFWKKLNGVGRIWILLLVLALVLGGLCVSMWPISFIRIFVVFPYVIFLIIIKSYEKISTKFENAQNGYLKDWAAQAEYGKAMMAKKSTTVLLMCVPPMIFVCVLLIEAFAIPRTSDIFWLISILFDVILLLSVENRIAELGNFLTNDVRGR